LSAAAGDASTSATKVDTTSNTGRSTRPE
jgi:hypothetical protein